MYLLGIDIGTGGTRAVVISQDGNVLSTASADHKPFDSPEIGWAEQDPEDWWNATTTAVRKVLSQSKDGANEIGAIGFSGQMHGAVLLDEDDKVLRPSIIWCDQRTEKQAAEITRVFGKDRLIELVSNPSLTNFTLTKMIWVRDNEPEIWDRTTSVLLPKDYVRFRLTGEKATDVSDASGTLLLDVKNRCWSGKMIEGLDLDSGILPLLYESQERAGAVTTAAARETDLKEGTPVIAGAGDNAAGAIGMGIVRAGDTGVTIGTSGVAFSVTDIPKIDLKGRIHTFCHAIPGRWHVTGVTQSAGLSFRWFRDTFEPGREFHELIKEAERVSPGADGLLWTPYLMGERTPHIDPAARASLIGLTVSHTRGHVIRAILEGVAFSLRDCIEVFKEAAVPIGTFRLGGGGAKSALWRQIQADVYGAAVETIKAEEGAAFGAALLAGVGTGVWNSVEEACDASIEVADRIEPDSGVSALMETRFRVYRKIYRAAASIE